MKTCKYIVNQITRRIYWTAYCVVLFFSIQNFEKLGVNLNGLVVKVLSISRFDSAFHPSEFDKMSIRNFWEDSLPPQSGSSLEGIEPHP